MRSRVIIVLSLTLFFVFLIGVVLTNQTNLAFAQDMGKKLKLKTNNDQELAETLQWIKGKEGMFKAYNYRITDNNDNRYYMAETTEDFSFNFDRCSVSIHTVVKKENGGKTPLSFSYVMDASFNLKDIASLKIVTPPQGYPGFTLINPAQYFTFETYNAAPNINYSSITTARVNCTGAEDESKNVSKFELGFNDRDMGERMLKAFENARKLCGAKEEKF